MTRRWIRIRRFASATAFDFGANHLMPLAGEVLDIMLPSRGRYEVAAVGDDERVTDDGFRVFQGDGDVTADQAMLVVGTLVFTGDPLRLRIWASR